jgi:hypothetical protein
MVMKRQDGEHGLFERLSETLTDPYVDRMFLRAKEYEEVLNTLDENPDDSVPAAQKFMHMLDAEWMYKGKNMVVTGIVATADENGNTIRDRIVETEVASNGFVFDRDEVTFEDETIMGEWRAALHMTVPHEKGTKGCVMYLRDIEHIEYPFPSNELRSVRYNYHRPAMATDIYTRIYDSATDNDVLYALRDLYFDMNEQFDDDTEELKDLISYLNNVSDLDLSVPWRLTINGEIGVTHDDGVTKAVSLATATHYYAQVHGITFTSWRNDEEKRGVTTRKFPSLHTTLYAKDKDKPNITAYIPLTSIHHAESLR